MTLEATLERMLGEKSDRNRDNVTRTESYLELYVLLREHGIELPWVLMAHVVSRNAGYLMTDLGVAREGSLFTADAVDEMFLFLERANFLIFDDAWHHLVAHVLGRPLGDETPRFMREAWGRYDRAKKQRGVDAALERSLVMDLVTNEQNLIEHRVVHNPRFAVARAMVGFFETTGTERPIALPATDAKIKVGGFADLAQRITTGQRIFDEVLAPRDRRDAVLAWCRDKRHTGSRRVYTEATRHDATLRDVWPVEKVRAMWTEVHGAMERDPHWP